MQSVQGLIFYHTSRRQMISSALRSNSEQHMQVLSLVRPMVLGMPQVGLTSQCGDIHSLQTIVRCQQFADAKNKCIPAVFVCARTRWHTHTHTHTKKNWPSQNAVQEGRPFPDNFRHKKKKRRRRNRGFCFKILHWFNFRFRIVLRQWR